MTSCVANPMLTQLEKNRFQRLLSIVIGSAALSAASMSSAATITVSPGDANWVSPLSENTGGGSSTITFTAPQSGNGSVELHGDRTRLFGLGNPYSSASNLGLLSSISNFKFDWMVEFRHILTGAAPPYLGRQSAK